MSRTESTNPMPPMPRVLVGCPTHELKSDSLEHYVQGLDTLTYPYYDVLIEDNSPTPDYAQRLQEHAAHWEKKHPGRTFEVLHTQNTTRTARERIVHGRNLIRERVLNGGYDYFLSLEQDLVPPANILERLLAHQKEVVSATYFNRKIVQGQHRIEIMAGYYHDPEEKARGVFRDYGFNLILPSCVMKVDYTGLGCTLISRTALEHISFRVNPETPHYDDMLFCMDLEKRGKEVFLDSGSWCRHYFNDALQKTT